ncbi:MAG: DNA-3-methyladenine glycosylase 2 family protein [Sphingomonadaceae bacterium]
MVSDTNIAEGMAALADIDPVFAAALAQYGLPAARERARGYVALLRVIVGQQLSTASAESIWRRLGASVADINRPEEILALSPQELRSIGLSSQKIAYVHSLASHVLRGDLSLDTLPADDEEAIRMISAVHGLGRWSAEIYLLLAEGRADIFPAGDLAVRLFPELGERPAEATLRRHAESWRPWRGVAAIFFWHCYRIQPL